jgi:plastocyanin
MKRFLKSRYHLQTVVILLVALNFLALTMVGGCNDNNGSSKRPENEPNNRFEDCTLVSSNVGIRGKIDPAGDQDYFCFDVEAGTMVTAELMPDEPLDPFLDFYGPGPGYPLIDSGDIFVDGEAPVAGRYYVVVGDVFDNGGPDYKYMLFITSVGPTPPPTLAPTPTPTPTIIPPPTLGPTLPPATPTPMPTATPIPTPTPVPTATPTPTPSPTPAPMIHDVSMESGNVFVPADITINVGDTIRWTNNDSINHDARSDDGTTFMSADEYPSPNFMTPGDMYEFTFNSEGEIPYFCILHGAAGGIGMSGTITVEP